MSVVRLLSTVYPCLCDEGLSKRRHGLPHGRRKRRKHEHDASDKRGPDPEHVRGQQQGKGHVRNIQTEDPTTWTLATSEAVVVFPKNVRHGSQRFRTGSFAATAARLVVLTLLSDRVKGVFEGVCTKAP